LGDKIRAGAAWYDRRRRSGFPHCSDSQNEKGWPWPPFCFRLSALTALCSVQTLDIAGNRFDILVAQLGSNGTHGHGIAVFGTVAFTEVVQLLADILGMLAAQFRIARRCQTGAVRRVATGTGRHAFFQLAATEQCLATRDQRR